MTPANGTAATITDEQLRTVQDHKTAPRDEPKSAREIAKPMLDRLRPTSLPQFAVEQQRAAREKLEREGRARRLITTCGAGTLHLEAELVRSDHPWWSWLDKIDARRGSGFTVAIYGPNGPGKTQMGVELVRAACKAGLPGIYTTATRLFLELRRGMKRDGQSEIEAIGEFVKPAILVIDEYQRRGETKWEDTQLEELIDWRYREKRDTVLISNLAKVPFEEMLGPAIISRMIECGAMIECNWPSFRTR